MIGLAAAFGVFELKRFMSLVFRIWGLPPHPTPTPLRLFGIAFLLPS